MDGGGRSYFSGAVKVEDLNDALGLAQDCIVPIVLPAGRAPAGAPSEAQNGAISGGAVSGGAVPGASSPGVGGGGEAPFPLLDVGGDRPNLIKLRKVQKAKAAVGGASSGLPQKTRAEVTLNDCLACSGCVTTSEVIIVKEQSLGVFFEKLREGRLLAVSLSPRSVSFVAAVYGLALPTAFRLLVFLFKNLCGACLVLATDLGDCLHLEETVRCVLERLPKSSGGDRGDAPPAQPAAAPKAVPALPAFASHCPGWVCYAEKSLDSAATARIAPVRSSQQIFGRVLKSLTAVAWRARRFAEVCALLRWHAAESGVGYYRLRKSVEAGGAGPPAAAAAAAAAENGGSLQAGGGDSRRRGGLSGEEGAGRSRLGEGFGEGFTILAATDTAAGDGAATVGDGGAGAAGGGATGRAVGATAGSPASSSSDPLPSFSCPPLDEPRFLHVTVMTCFDKKLETARPSSAGDEKEVDIVLATVEVLELMKRLLAGGKSPPERPGEPTTPPIGAKLRPEPPLAPGNAAAPLGARGDGFSGAPRDFSSAASLAAAALSAARAGAEPRLTPYIAAQPLPLERCTADDVFLGLDRSWPEVFDPAFRGAGAAAAASTGARGGGKSAEATPKAPAAVSGAAAGEDAAANAASASPAALGSYSACLRPPAAGVADAARLSALPSSPLNSPFSPTAEAAVFLTARESYAPARATDGTEGKPSLQAPAADSRLEEVRLSPAAAATEAPASGAVGGASLPAALGAATGLTPEVFPPPAEGLAVTAGRGTGGGAEPLSRRRTSGVPSPPDAAFPGLPPGTAPSKSPPQPRQTASSLPAPLSHPSAVCPCCRPRRFARENCASLGLAEAVCETVVRATPASAVRAADETDPVTGLTFLAVRNMHSGETLVRCALAYGFRNLHNAVRLRPRADRVDFIEAMACPRGCVGGSGQVAPHDAGGETRPPPAPELGTEISFFDFPGVGIVRNFFAAHHGWIGASFAPAGSGADGAVEMAAPAAAGVAVTTLRW